MQEMSQKKTTELIISSDVSSLRYDVVIGRALYRVGESRFSSYRHRILLYSPTTNWRRPSTALNPEAALIQHGLRRHRKYELEASKGPYAP